LIAPTQQHEAEQWYDQAKAFLARGRQRDAVRALTRVMELAPGFVSAYVDRGLILLEAGLSEQALADFNQALWLAPEYGPAYYGRSWARHTSGDHQGALEDAQHGMELDPDNSALYRRRIGVAYHGLRQYNQALVEYDAILDADPQDQNTRYNRALCYADMGQNALALVDLTRTLAMDPGWSLALQARAALYAELYKYKLAYADIVEAGRHDPQARSQRRFLWVMAHPIRSMIGLVALLAFALFVILSTTLPPLRLDSVVELDGRLVSIVDGDRDDLVLSLAGYNDSFQILAGDRPLLAEQGFRATVHPGDQLHLSVLKTQLQQPQSDHQLTVFQVRSDRGVYLSLDATIGSRRRDMLITMPLGVLGSLLVLGLAVGPLFRSPWRS
jgi:tetratricopeptide (TPR) repeat protein